MHLSSIKLNHTIGNGEEVKEEKRNRKRKRKQKGRNDGPLSRVLP